MGLSCEEFPVFASSTNVLVRLIAGWWVQTTGGHLRGGGALRETGQHLDQICDAPHMLHPLHRPSSFAASHYLDASYIVKDSMGAEGR